MKRRNKFVALGLTAAVVATSLAGCGGSSGSGGSGGGDSSAPLTVAIGDGGQQA